MSEKPEQSAEGKLAEYLGGYSEEDIKVLSNTVAKGCSRTELAYFLRVAQTVGLNPFNREIWCYKDHKGNQVVFAGRDGFLKAAQQRTDFGGIRSAPVYENDAIQMDLASAQVNHSPALDDRGKLLGAWCKVFRKDAEDTLEYVRLEDRRRNTPVWKSYPSDMVRKDAELIALKKAFGLVMQNPDDFRVDDQGTAQTLKTGVDEEEKRAMKRIEQVGSDQAKKEFSEEFLSNHPDIRAKLDDQ